MRCRLKKIKNWEIVKKRLCGTAFFEVIMVFLLNSLLQPLIGILGQQVLMKSKIPLIRRGAGMLGSFRLTLF